MWDQAKGQTVAEVVRLGGMFDDNKALVQQARRTPSKEEGILIHVQTLARGHCMTMDGVGVGVLPTFEGRRQ